LFSLLFCVIVTIWMSKETRKFTLEILEEEGWGGGGQKCSNGFNLEQKKGQANQDPGKWPAIFRWHEFIAFRLIFLFT
jgi:hypothetical protein